MTFDELQARLENAERSHRAATEWLVYCRSERDAACPHTHKTVESTYFPGDYLNTSYTEYREKCSVCGRAFKTWTKDEGYYG